MFLNEAEREGIKKGVALGFSVGLMLFSFYAMYGISTYAGAEFIIMSRIEDPECVTNPQKPSCFTGIYMHALGSGRSICMLMILESHVCVCLCVDENGS